MLVWLEYGGCGGRGDPGGGDPFVSGKFYYDNNDNNRYFKGANLNKALTVSAAY